MNVLILSCNTGGGHNACASAIQEALERRGDRCTVADSLRFGSGGLSGFLSWGHTTVYRNLPGLFRIGYGFAEKHPAILREGSAVYRLLTGGSKQLFNFIRQGQYDAVICTHVFAGLLLKQTLKEHPMPVRTAFIGTDYTCSPGTALSGLDRYFIPAASLAEEFTGQGIPAEKIVTSGIPVRKEFCEASDKAQAKENRGIDPSREHLLMMCGSMGCGPMERLAELLSAGMDANMELTIVCGTNKKLCSRLIRRFEGVPNVHIRGFVPDMAGLMDSADLYLTKPGGLSTTEAAAKRLPMVLVDAVAGCETYNLRYFTGLGGAVTAGDPAELCRLCLALMKDAPRRARMREALASLPCRTAAQRVCDMIRSGQEVGGV